VWRVAKADVGGGFLCAREENSGPNCGPCRRCCTLLITFVCRNARGSFGGKPTLSRFVVVSLFVPRIYLRVMARLLVHLRLGFKCCDLKILVGSLMPPSFPISFALDRLALNDHSSLALANFLA